MRPRPHLIASIVVCALIGVSAPTASAAAPRWAPASKATIHPGVRVSTCTANFVFYDSRYVYLGLSATCAPSWGTKVKIEGASRPGTIVYDSGVVGCCGNHPNDFALVRLDNADKGKVNPSVPFWGGPTGGGGRSKTGNLVYSYGNYVSPSDSTDRSPKVGVDTSPVETNVTFADKAQRAVHHPFRETSTGGWTHYAQMVLPAAGNYECDPRSDELCGADMGAPVLDARGRAFGVLGAWAHDTSSRVTDLTKAIAYMKAHTSLDAIQLAKGTEPFLPRSDPREY
jgi:hypothetical protein